MVKPPDLPDFQALFHAAPGLFLVLVPDFTIVAASDAYLKATLTKRGEILGRGIFDVFPDNPADTTADGVRNLRASLERVIAGRAPDRMPIQKYDIRRPQSEGGAFEVRYWSPLNSPVLDPAGRLTHIIHQVEDVTEMVTLKQKGVEQERIAAALRASKEWFSTTLSSIGDAVIATDTANAVLFMNPVAADLTGWRPDEAAGQPVADVFRIVNETTRSPVENPVEKVLETGRGVGLANHTVLIARDGTERPIDDSAAPIRDERGQVSGCVLVFRDISERKRAEEREREAEVRFGMIFEAMAEGFCVVEVVFDEHDRPIDYRFLEVNPAFEKQTGIQAARGRSMREIAPDHEQHWFDTYGHIALTGETLRFVNQAAALHRWYEVCAFRVGPAELRRVGIVFNDVTDRQRAEQAIRQQAERLRESDRRKDEFLAMLAHELRNPLASVSNAIQLLRMPRVPAEYAESSREVIERQVKHLARMLDDLLDVSRITRGKIELRKVRIDVSPVINSAVDAVRHLIEQKGQELAVSFTPGTLWCEVDPTRLEQVLTNLLTNATRYTGAGGQIRLAAGHRGEKVTFTVKDNGIGIPPDRLPEMFDLFAQGDRSIARSEGGLGIGLTVVKRIAELHGGTATAASEGPGQGSEFTVTLPAMPQPKAEPATPPAAGPKPGRSSRILVVDDNVDTARGLARLLTLLGNDLRTAHDGPSAITEALAFRPEYILLDIGLPGLDGYQVAKRLREEGLRNAVIIAITGYGQEEDRRRSKEAGFDHHLVKPVDFDALVTLIGQTIA